jgi:glycine/betaine/sarcosine/D-proline reductase family selenoprotein B
VAVLTALPDVQRSMGVNRIVPGVAITSVLGDPTVPAETERGIRERVVRTALRALAQKVDGPTVIEAQQGE